MKTLLLIAYIIIAITCEKSKNIISKCEGVHIKGEFHRKSVIINGINRPYQLAIYNKDHKVFFSYNIGDDKKDTFAIAYVKINDTRPTDVDIKDGFAIAIDELQHTAYFGSNKGIYTDNLKKSDGLKHIVKDYDIWDIFFHEHLYFIAYPSQRLYKYEKDKNLTLVEHIHEKLYQFVVDGDNDIFITTKDGLHLIKSNTTERISFGEPKIFRAIEVNHAGVAHFCAQNAIYVANKKKHTLVEIANIKNIFGLAFDSSDNFIYSNPHEIVKLLPGHCQPNKKT